MFINEETGCHPLRLPETNVIFRAFIPVDPIQSPQMAAHHVPPLKSCLIFLKIIMSYKPELSFVKRS
jgi:hypothetical protein